MALLELNIYVAKYHSHSYKESSMISSTREFTLKFTNCLKEVIKKKKNTWILGLGQVAQVIEHLPTKHKALNSDLSTKKKKKQNLNPTKFTH
jgi:hypothetical protein